MAQVVNRLWEWVRLPVFGLQDVSGKTIDRQATFQPTPKPAYIAIKLAFLISTITVTCAAIADIWDGGFFFFAFLTYWGNILCIIYYICSLALMTNPDINSNRAHLLTKVDWGIFSMTVNMQLFISVNYWLLVYDGADEYQWFDFYNHGGNLIVLMLDGFGIHRIPIRFKQISFHYAVQIIYLLWTVAHALSGIGNPLEDDRDTIYASLNWKEWPGQSAFLAAILLFVAVPLCFLVTWAISWLVPKRYLYETGDEVAVDSTGDKEDNFQSDIELAAD